MRIRALDKHALAVLALILLLVPTVADIGHGARHAELSRENTVEAHHHAAGTSGAAYTPSNGDVQLHPSDHAHLRCDTGAVSRQPHPDIGNLARVVDLNWPARTIQETLQAPASALPTARCTGPPPRLRAPPTLI